MPNKLQSKFIKDCLDNLDKLNEWENDFINSIADIPDNKELSVRQNHTLNKCIKKVNDDAEYDYGQSQEYKPLYR